MKTPKKKGNSAKIQSIILIVFGFILIFSILTSMILYTVYDRSFINFIQGIGREEEVPTPEPQPEVKPSMLLESTANAQYSEGLWILSDSVLAGIKEIDISAKDRHFSTSFVSTTNYMEATFSGCASPDVSYTIAEFLAANTPKYLLINFSGTGLSLTEEATENLYRAIVDLILSESPETTVILSGPLPVTSNSDIDAQAVIRLDQTLSALCDSLYEGGKPVYYLASPASFFDTNKYLKTEYALDTDVLNALGCELYFNYILRHPVPVTKE